jgi:hypothetical protein
VGHVACIRAVRKIYILLAGKLERKRPLRRPRRRWEGNNRMDVREKVWEVVN